MKVMGHVHNWDQAEFPRMLKTYNDKPCLINKSGDNIKNLTNANPALRYMEQTVNVNKFSKIALQGLFQLKSRVEKCKVTFASVIEGRTEEEMPEIALGTMDIYSVMFFDGKHILTPEAEAWLIAAAEKEGRMIPEMPTL
jgi:hypothetical protein